jgi:hypothetical protein
MQTATASRTRGSSSAESGQYRGLGDDIAYEAGASCDTSGGLTILSHCEKAAFMSAGCEAHVRRIGDLGIALNRAQSWSALACSRKQCWRRYGILCQVSLAVAAEPGGVACLRVNVAGECCHGGSSGRGTLSAQDQERAGSRHADARSSSPRPHGTGSGYGDRGRRDRGGER